MADPITVARGYKSRTGLVNPVREQEERATARLVPAVRERKRRVSVREGSLRLQRNRTPLRRSGGVSIP